MINEETRARTKIKILQVNTNSNSGGASRIAHDLFTVYRQLGYSSWMAVRKKEEDNPDILQIPRPGQPQYLWSRAGSFLRRHEFPAVPDRFVDWVGNLPGSWAEVERRRGYEDFNYPASWHVLDLPPEKPDILHLHNLHGWYFDLRALPYLGRQVPMTITMHDAWLLSGHCSHSFNCYRWKTGCGSCPDLDIYPAVENDATAYNWKRKQRIYSRTRLYVTAPSHWLLQKASHSMMGPFMTKGRVIPNGVNREIFRPGDRAAARARLEIPQDAAVVMFAANLIHTNPYKDIATMWAAINLLAKDWTGRDILFLAVGEDAPQECIGRVKVRFIPYLDDPGRVAEYYQAADIYIHAACPEAETFPNTILEAHACGLPVVATASGGIPEQVIDGETGFLTPAGDPQAMKEKIALLLEDGPLRQRMGHQAVQDTAVRFDIQDEAARYIEWYQEVIQDWKIERACR